MGLFGCGLVLFIVALTIQVDRIDMPFAKKIWGCELFNSS